MSYTPGKGAVISVGVDGAAASRRDIDSVGDTLRRLNESNFQKLTAQLTAAQGTIQSVATSAKTLGINVGSLESNLAKAQSSVASLTKGFILGAAAGMSIDAIKDKIFGVIDSMAHLKTVSEKTGSSVENLSKLGFAAKQSGSDIDSIADALGKMSKGMAGADNDTKGAGLALKFLGILAKDTAGNLKDPAAMFTEVAKKLDDYQDGAGKAAIAQALFGKAGAEMLPTLKLLGEQGDSVAKVTEAQATAARQYTRDIAKLDGQKNMLFKTVAVALLPTMTDFANVLLDTSKKTNLVNGAAKDLAADNSIGSWADSGAMGLSRLLDVVVFVSKGVSTLIGSFKAVAADIAFFSKASEIINPIGTAKIIARGGNPNEELRAALAERNKIVDNSNAKLDDLLNYNGAAMEQAMAARISKRVNVRADDTEDAAMATPWGRNPKKALNYNSSGEDGDTKATAAINKEASAYATLTAAIGERMAAATAEANGLKTLNEAQQLQVALNEQLASGKLKLTAAHKLEYQGKINSLAAELDVIASQKRAAQGAAEWQKIAKDQKEAAAKSIEDATKEADKNEDLARTFGMTKDAIEAMQLARLEEQLAQRSSTGMVLDEIETLEKLVAAKQRSAIALATVDGLEKQKATWASIDQTAHNVFTSMFDAGKSTFDRLRDTLKGGLLDLLYQMTIKKWIFNIGTAVTGNASGLSSAAGALSSAANTGSIGASVLSTIGTAGSAISAAGTLFGSAAVGAFGSGLSAGVAGTSVAEAVAAYSAAGMGGVAGGLSAGSAIGSGAASIVSSASAALAAVPVWGWAALGAAAIYAWASDSGPEDHTRLGFTSNNTAGNISINERGNEGKNSAYIDPGVSSSFGTFGVSSSFWMSSSSPTVKSFLTTVAQTDDALATFLTATERASVSSFLTGKVSTAHTGAEGSDPNANGELDGVFRERIANIFDGIEPGLASLVTGFSGTSQALATEAQALLQYRSALKDSGEAVFGAKVTLQDLAALKTPTEGTSAALVRITGEFNTTNQVLDLLGKTSTQAFGASGLASEAARQQLIQLSGGVAAMSTQAASFAQNYFTDAERLIPVSKSLDVALSALGLQSIPTSREQFRGLIDTLTSTGAIATETGARQYAGLMSIADAFAQVHPLIEATTGALRSQADILSERTDLRNQLDQLTMTSSQLLMKQRMALDASNRGIFDQIQMAQKARDAQDAAKTSLGGVISNMKSFADSTKSLSSGLLTGNLSNLTPMQQYAETKREYEKTLLAAKGGDVAAQGQYSAMASAFLTASQKVNASDAQYSADFSSVVQTTGNLAQWASGQVDVAQASLDALNAQVSGIAGLNTTMQSIAQGIAELPSAFSSPLAVPINYSSMGTTDMVPLAAEIKALREEGRSLREEIRGLRADQERQTGDMMGRTDQATDKAADKIVAGSREAAAEGRWVADNPNRRRPSA